MKKSTKCILACLSLSSSLNAMEPAPSAIPSEPETPIQMPEAAQLLGPSSQKFKNIPSGRQPQSDSRAQEAQGAALSITSEMLVKSFLQAIACEEAIRKNKHQIARGERAMDACVSQAIDSSQKRDTVASYELKLDALKSAVTKDIDRLNNTLDTLQHSLNQVAPELKRAFLGHVSIHRINQCLAESSGLDASLVEFFRERESQQAALQTTLLIECAHRNSLCVADFLLKSGANPNALSFFGNEADAHGPIAASSFVDASQRNPHRLHAQGRETALYAAFSRGFIQLANLLAIKGAVFTGYQSNADGSPVGSLCYHYGHYASFIPFSTSYMHAFSYLTNYSKLPLPSMSLKACGDLILFYSTIRKRLSFRDHLLLLLFTQKKSFWSLKVQIQKDLCQKLKIENAAYPYQMLSLSDLEAYYKDSQESNPFTPSSDSLLESLTEIFKLKKMIPREARDLIQANVNELKEELKQDAKLLASPDKAPSIHKNPSVLSALKKRNQSTQSSIILLSSLDSLLEKIEEEIPEIPALAP